MATILGIDWKAANDLTEDAVPTGAQEVSPTLRRELYAALAEEYTALAKLYPDAVAKWRSRQEGLVGG